MDFLNNLVSSSCRKGTAVLGALLPFFPRVRGKKRVTLGRGSFGQEEDTRLFKKAAFPLWVLATLLVAVVGAEAATKKKVEKKSAGKKAASTSSSKKKTVAELLSQARLKDRGGTEQMKKAEVALPESKLGFQNSGRNLEVVKPPRSAEIFTREGGVRAEYERILDRQIEELYSLTQKFKDSNNRGELWLRLAELYIEKATIIDSRKQDDFDAKLKAFQEGKIKTKPSLDLSSARTYNRKAIQLYEWFLRDFPKDVKVPQALFFLGFNYFELGKNKEAVEYYERLVRSYPRSNFLSEAYFALGEYYFEGEKWASAYKNYSQLIKDKTHRLYTMSLYKSAWSLYRLGKYKQALNYMEYIIKTGRQETGSELAMKKTVNRARLESEALRDVVVFYADVGAATTAQTYFEQLVGSDFTPYLEKLAYYYSDRGDRESSGIVLRQLIHNNPSSPKAFDYQYQIVQNYFYAKNSPKFKEELYRWIKDYDEKSSWYAANQNNPTLLQNSYRLRELTLRNYILQQHQTAQNSRAPYSQGLAQEGYILYIQEFSTSPQFVNMKFYYGELLYDMGKYDEAGQQYNWIVQNATDSKYFNVAATNLIHSVEKGIPKDKDIKKLADTADPVPLSPKVERFIKAGNWYSEKFSQSNKVPEIKFRIGRLYYQHNHFDEAMETFKEIVKLYPRTKFAEYSANLILDIYNIKKDYAGMEKTGTELLAVPSIADSKAGSDIRGVLEKASFKKAQDLEGQKKYVESAQQFESFAKQNPKSELAATAYFNSAVNYEKGGAYSSAVVNYNKVIGANSKEAESLKKRSRRLLGKIYQDSGQFEMAARLFKQVAQDDPKDPLSANLMFTAAVLYEALGRYDEAVKSYNEFIKMNKSNQENLDAEFSIAQIHRRAKQKSAAIHRFEDYIASNPSDVLKTMEAHYWLMEWSPKQKSDEWAKKIIGFHKNLSGERKTQTAKYAARARLHLARQTLQEYEAVRIPENPNSLKAALDKKLELLNVLKRNVTEVIQYNTAEEIVSALTLLGKAYSHMGDSFMRAPVPKGLTDTELKAYKEKVQKELAQPQYTQATEAFKKAVEKAWDLEVSNDDYKYSLARLNKEDPKSYYDNGEMSLDNRYVNWMVE